MNYNILKKGELNVTKKHAEFFKRNSKRLFDEMQDQAVYPVMNAVDTVELKFYNHNAEEFSKEPEPMLDDMTQTLSTSIMDQTKQGIQALYKLAGPSVS